MCAQLYSRWRGATRAWDGYCDRSVPVIDTIVLKQSGLVSADQPCRSPFSIRGLIDSARVHHACLNVNDAFWPPSHGYSKDPEYSHL
ncbi:protein of unknown function [Paraburkholderia dioscoreae]|uniref:Uncharacterized protein n=1 Tax=Paraburkholderia dioscoreae TaxID=2604047 RepID=A0A5Q4Z2V1_9BURK|nr:protein of unknown function [Paraburkholderia dioscoreae]